MTEDQDDEETGVLEKIVLTGVVVVLAVPGLIIEPGPFSEIVAGGLLIAIWFGDSDAEDIASEATATEASD